MLCPRPGSAPSADPLPQILARRHGPPHCRVQHCRSCVSVEHESVLADRDPRHTSSVDEGKGAVCFSFAPQAISKVSNHTVVGGLWVNMLCVHLHDMLWHQGNITPMPPKTFVVKGGYSVLLPKGSFIPYSTHPSVRWGGECTCCVGRLIPCM